MNFEQNQIFFQIYSEQPGGLRLVAGQSAVKLRDFRDAYPRYRVAMEVSLNLSRQNFTQVFFIFLACQFNAGGKRMLGGFAAVYES